MFKGFHSMTPTGELKHVVSILQPNITGARNGSGDLIATTTFATGVFAAVEFIRQRFSEKSYGESDDSTHKIIIRTIPGITSSMVVVHNGADYRIQNVVPNPEAPDFELWLFCRLVDGG